MPEELLPKPETDLPLPEKELTSGEEAASQITVRNQNPPKESKHLLRAFLFGFLFVAILAAIGGVYFLGINKSNSKNKQTVTVKIVPPSPTPDPTTDWQTFTSSKFGFSIKYPNSITPSENTTSFYALIFKKTNAAPGEFDKYTILASPDTFITKDPASYDFLSSDVVDNLIALKPGENVQIGSITFTKLPDQKIDGKNITMATVTSADGSTHQKRAVIKNNGNMYMLVDEQNIEPEVFENMLKTLKFINLEPVINNSEIQSAAEKELGDGYIKVRITKMYGENYALGSAGFKTPGGGISFVIHKENGTWKIISKGNESPGCSTVINYSDFPKDLCSPEY